VTANCLQNLKEFTEDFKQRPPPKSTFPYFLSKYEAVLIEMEQFGTTDFWSCGLT
jgi:hypothetical protein